MGSVPQRLRSGKAAADFQPGGEKIILAPCGQLPDGIGGCGEKIPERIGCDECPVPPAVITIEMKGKKILPDHCPEDIGASPLMIIPPCRIYLPDIPADPQDHHRHRNLPDGKKARTDLDAGFAE